MTTSQNNIEGTLKYEFAGKERSFKLTFINLSNIEDRLGQPIMKIVNGFGTGNVGVGNVSVILHEALTGAGGKYTYEAVGNMCLQHGFGNCLNIVSEILLTSMGLNEQADNNKQQLPLESSENETESK
tara:strand:+ start:604 stop:987 length:384 start_codon:yes stop_codon:yes gene_type:complete